MTYIRVEGIGFAIGSRVLDDFGSAHIQGTLATGGHRRFQAKKLHCPRAAFQFWDQRLDFSLWAIHSEVIEWRIRKRESHSGKKDQPLAIFGSPKISMSAGSTGTSSHFE